MKTVTISLLLIASACTCTVDTSSDTVPGVNVQVYACIPSDGDCKRIIVRNHLSDTPCDSLGMRYPVYVVTFENVLYPTDMAYAPSIFIGTTEVRGWGSGGAGIYAKIYCDSAVESYAGETVTVYPPLYPESADPLQFGIFPDAATIDSLQSSARNGMPTLPTVPEVLRNL